MSIREVIKFNYCFTINNYSDPDTINVPPVDLRPALRPRKFTNVDTIRAIKSIITPPEG